MRMRYCLAMSWFLLLAPVSRAGYKFRDYQVGWGAAAICRRSPRRPLRRLLSARLPGRPGLLARSRTLLAEQGLNRAAPGFGLPLDLGHHGGGPRGEGRFRAVPPHALGDLPDHRAVQAQPLELGHHPEPPLHTVVELHPERFDAA